MPTLSAQVREATSSQARLNSLSTSNLDLLRKIILNDPYEWAILCGHKDITEDFHKPLLYIAARRVDLLVPLLNDPAAVAASYVLRQLRNELAVRRGIDWNTPEGAARFMELLHRVNLRCNRASGKSSCITHAETLRSITLDPNKLTALICCTDPRAYSFCEQIGESVLSSWYGTFFGAKCGPWKRVPDSVSKSINRDSIWLAGRSISSPQASLEARGIRSNWAGPHFAKFVLDDLTGMEAATQGELAYVNQFLAMMTGMYMPLATIERTHVGTVYDMADDHATLMADDNVLSIVVPIEVYDRPPRDISVRGTPTNPGWHPVAKIQKLFEEVTADPLQGPLAWQLNYLLDARGAGGQIFPEWALRNNVFRWVPQNGVSSGNGALVRRLTVTDQGEPANLLGKPLTDAAGKVKEGLEGRPHLVTSDPMRMFRVMTVDQSFSDSGDEWAIVVLSSDPSGYEYLLEVRKGRGYAEMLQSVGYLDEVWNPNLIGIEGGSSQDVTRLWMKEDKRFRRMAGRIVGVPHNSIRKEHRIRNNFAGRLCMGRLLLNPLDTLTPAEARAYNPARRAPVDNILDCTAMASALMRRNMGKDAKGRDWKAQLAERDQKYYREEDPLVLLRKAS